MQILAVLGFLVTAGIVAADFYNVVGNGEYKNWGIGDWLFNIFTTLAVILPFVDSSTSILKSVNSKVGGILAKIPFLGKIYAKAASVGSSINYYAKLFYAKMFGSQGFLLPLVFAGKGILKFLSNPVGFFALLVASQFFEGLLHNFFMIVGNLILKISMTVLGIVLSLCTDKYGNVWDAVVSVFENNYALLPECVGLMLAALHVQDLVGMVTSVVSWMITFKIVRSAYSFVRPVGSAI